MLFEENLSHILEGYYQEYIRPLVYLDPRNKSKTGNANLFNEHNQTVSFYHALRQVFPKAVGWFELSIGKNPPNTPAGRESTNAIDGIVYIPECSCLLIIEAKGLRRPSKFLAIADDLQRTFGTNRSSTEAIANYRLKLKEKPHHVYAVILSDIWSSSERKEHGWEWDIRFDKEDILESRSQCQKAFAQFRALPGLKDNPSVQWWSSKTFQPAPDAPNYRLLALICPLSQAQIDTYHWI